MELLLIFDDFADSASKGLRGVSGARHLLFQSNEWHLDLIVSRAPDAIRLTGQILPRTSTDYSSVFNAVIVLMHGGADELVESGALSSRGEFEFRDVPNSHLRIEVFLKAHRLTASFHP